MQQTANYPDIFGFITDIERRNEGVIQVGVAVRPQQVQAGRPFEVIALIQNTVDSEVEVVVSLELPGKDVAGKKDKFSAVKDRLAVLLAPSEVGYVSLPVVAKPDAAVGGEYSICVSVSAKAKEKKPRRIREDKGGGRFNPERVPSKIRKHLDVLQKLTFSSETRGGFLKGGGIQATFSLVKGGATENPSNLKPGWVSLWTLGTQSDAEPLLDKYGEMLRVKILPALKHQHLVQPLQEKTTERFKDAGYPLTDVEASTIARLLALILECAIAGELVAQTGQFAGTYNVMSIVNTKRLPGEDHERVLPRWTIALLQAIAKDERVAGVPPSRSVPHFAYDTLLYDAIVFGLQLVEHRSGEELGTAEEMAEYAGQTMRRIVKDGGLGFGDVFLPLVLAGILVTDLMLLKDERVNDVLRTLIPIFDRRSDEENTETAFIFDLGRDLLDKTLRQYGVLDSGR